MLVHICESEGLALNPASVAAQKSDLARKLSPNPDFRIDVNPYSSTTDDALAKDISRTILEVEALQQGMVKMLQGSTTQAPEVLRAQVLRGMARVFQQSTSSVDLNDGAAMDQMIDAAAKATFGPATDATPFIAANRDALTTMTATIRAVAATAGSRSTVLTEMHRRKKQIFAAIEAHDINSIDAATIEEQSVVVDAVVVEDPPAPAAPAAPAMVETTILDATHVYTGGNYNALGSLTLDFTKIIKMEIGFTVHANHNSGRLVNTDYFQIHYTGTPSLIMTVGNGGASNLLTLGRDDAQSTPGHYASTYTWDLYGSAGIQFGVPTMLKIEIQQEAGVKLEMKNYTKGLNDADSAYTPVSTYTSTHSTNTNRGTETSNWYAGNNYSSNIRPFNGTIHSIKIAQLHST